MAETELAVLADRAYQIATHFAPVYGQPASAPAFEIAFKLTAPDRQLVVMQVRPDVAD